MRFKTQPFPHQLPEFERSKDLPARALFWVPRAGKAWLTLNVAAHLYLRGEVTGLLILVPRVAVRDVWVEQQVPDHLCDDVPRTAMAYRTGSARTQRQRREFDALLAFEGLAILVMTYDSFKTPLGNDAARRFLLRRECFYVLDESHWIKTPGSKTSKKVLAVGSKSDAKSSRLAAPWLAPYRWILTGTPATAGAFDIYAQMRFLNPRIWAGHGWRTFAAFKTQFGTFERGYNGRSGKSYDAVVGYRNLGLMRKIIEPYVSRITERDLVGMPQKLYSTYRFDLSEEQRRVYDDLADKYRAELETEFERRGRVTATLGVVRAMRLHQVSCGYVRDDEGVLHAFSPNPRLDLLGELVSDLPEDHPVIVWCAHRPEVDAVGGRFTELFGRGCWAQMDGRVPAEGLTGAMRDFAEGRVRFVVATPAIASEGLDLRTARTVFYYSNSDKLRERLQSEDRAVALGKVAPVQYVDLVARGTVDARILRTYRRNLEVAAELTGDGWREWFEAGAVVEA